MTNNIIFEEVSKISGIDYLGSSHGAAWGDFNGDTYPDLWVPNHYQEIGQLYLNLGDGTFSNVTNEVFLQKAKGDLHGAAWADFDNDGDRDLIQLVGGGRGVGIGSNQMYVNNGGILENHASELKIDDPLLRGRTPLWFDFDKDGWLDIFLGAASRPDDLAFPTIFHQTDSGFEDARLTTGFPLSFSLFGILSDLTGDNNLDGVFSFFQDNSSGLRVYDITTVPFENVTATPILDTISVNDITAADFNNDLRPDLYVTRQGISSDLGQNDSNTAKARIIANGDRQGFRFHSSSNVEFDLSINSLSHLFPDIYIGAGGFNPNSLHFTLSPDNPDVEGILRHTSGVDRGIYIGYDSTQQSWQVLVSSPNKVDLRASINTSEPLFDLAAIGFDYDPIPTQDQLFLNTDRGLVDLSQETGINSIPIAGNSVISGDLDNDMDLDLYIVATGNARNRPNILYENQGDGTFMAVSNAGGAEGTNLGIGDSVVTADYDLDGFLDLFVTNGDGATNLTFDAPYQLFHNRGNENNWLEIDLEGVVSNRDGIGTQVYATTGGITQLREQSGGTHHRSQNHQRLHFGLADYTHVDEIAIKWTNGREQIINNVSANQLLHIIEPSDSFTPQLNLDSSQRDNGFNAYFNGDSRAIVGINLTLSDPNSLNISGATIAISNSLDGEAERLTVDTGNTAITSNYNSDLGILTLSGLDSVPNYQQVLRTATYSNTAEHPDRTSRIIEFAVSDEESPSNQSEVATTILGMFNHNPTVTTAIVDRTINQHEEFNLTLPSNTFGDEDRDDLSMTVTLANGNVLPDWLSFDPDTATFSGTPTAEDIGKMTIAVTADDGNGGTVEETFDLTVNAFELFRFRNTTVDTGTYVFVGAAERDAILDNSDLNYIFELEGLAFQASLEPEDNLIPLYRLKSERTVGTFLFVSTEEYDAIFAEDSVQKENWIEEGFDMNGNDIPEFYMYNPEANLGIGYNCFQNNQNGTFLYAGPEETEAIHNNSDFAAAFSDLGVAFAAF